MNEAIITEENNTEILQLVSFRIGNETFGIDILKAQEIIRRLPITKIPNSPEFVEGIINLRGKVIPVVDLRIRIGLKKIEETINMRIIVVEIKGKTVGFIVDSVSEVLRIPTSTLEDSPELVSSNVNSEFITSVAKLEDQLLILLDLEKVIEVGSL